MANKTTMYKSKAKILLCSNEESTIKKIKGVLEEENYYINELTDYKQLLNKIERREYNILILDYSLRNNDNSIISDALLKLIRECDKYIFIILLYDSKDITSLIEEIKSLRVQACIEKNDNYCNLLLQVECIYRTVIHYKNLFFNMEFSDILKTLRVISGYSQEDLAKLVNLNRGTIIDYENGHSIPSYEVLNKLAKVFRIRNIDFLMGNLFY